MQPSSDGGPDFQQQETSRKENDMAIQDPGGLFVMLLSNVRHGAERATNLYHERRSRRP